MLANLNEECWLHERAGFFQADPPSYPSLWPIGGQCARLQAKGSSSAIKLRWQQVEEEEDAGDAGGGLPVVVCNFVSTRILGIRAKNLFE